MTTLPLSGCGASIADRRCVKCGRRAALDAYCCQGGASAGYQRSAFCTVGVDVASQPRYPWHFIQADAVDFIHAFGRLYAFIHASPPCQLYSKCQRIMGNDHPDLITPTRRALIMTGRPWVIENVEDARAELRHPVTLCGSMFPGLYTYRHRLFETSFPLATPPHLAHAELTVKMGRALQPGDWYHAVGNFSGVSYVRENLDFSWMSRDGLRESIPWQYAKYVGDAALGSEALADRCARVALCGAHATVDHDPYCGPECERIGRLVDRVVKDRGDRPHLAPEPELAARFAWPWLDVRADKAAS